MMTILNYEDAESLIVRGNEEFRLNINPSVINKFQLYLTAGKITKGVEIVGVGPASMRAYYSLLEYSQLVGLALEKNYRVYIVKDGELFQKGDWYLVFRI
jgi:hypothetical protein